MKITRANTLRAIRSDDDLIKYLQVYLSKTLEEIVTVLNNLTFKENFKSQTVTVTIKAGAEQAIEHNLGTVPAGKLIVKAQTSQIVDGPTEWTNEKVYLLNSSASDQTITVIILGG